MTYAMKSLYKKAMDRISRTGGGPVVITSQSEHYAFLLAWRDFSGRGGYVARYEGKWLGPGTYRLDGYPTPISTATVEYAGPVPQLELDLG